MVTGRKYDLLRKLSDSLSRRTEALGRNQSKYSDRQHGGSSWLYSSQPALLLCPLLPSLQRPQGGRAVPDQVRLPQPGTGGCQAGRQVR